MCRTIILNCVSCQRLLKVTSLHIKNLCFTIYNRTANASTLSSVYDPAIESEIQTRWKNSENVNTPKQREPFSMILPPPNVTGELHLGHALTITIQDVICRWKQMQSQDVCWVPGFDHAGIATQAIVERSLFAKNGYTREQLGQDKLLEEIWTWKREKRKKMSDQIRSLGTILDWSREIFTLDKSQEESVKHAVKQLWERDLIYREAALVNWCCHLGSVLSDIEVKNVNVSGPTPLLLSGQETPVVFGRIVRFSYPVQGKDDEIIVATTRPETILGDVAVAVHPSDHRYSHLHGAQLRHPLTDEVVPLILDQDVDINFGTGALKITPAHDLLDYKIGKRHSLPLKQAINENGNLSDKCGVYSGMNRWCAREKIIEDLAKRGYLRGIDPHLMQVPTCSRSGDVIERILKPQWFIKCKEMAAKAAACVRDGQLVLEPEKLNNMWFTWMENINDWCISRQVWWGHQAPFYNIVCGEDNTWLCAMNAEEALQKGQSIFKSSAITVSKDTDVLDTWFSSAILPFTTYGWPHQSADFQRYYPLSLMVTGHDILFFWVARMVMLGLDLTQKLPFKKVLLHGVICDHQGRKMSKSKGNVVDPMHVIKGCTLMDLKNEIITNQKNGIIDKDELQTALSGMTNMFPDGIPKCGVDSLRLSLLAQPIKDTYINFSVKECQLNALFCNKLWQATKFILGWSEKLEINGKRNFPIVTNLNQIDRWIISRLSKMVDNVNKSLELNEFHLAVSTLKQFLYSDFCSVYLECTKPFLNSNNKHSAEICCDVLLFCLEIYLRCLAPFMPHICEELYSKLPVRKNEDSIFRCSMPFNLQLHDKELEQKVDRILYVVETIRRLKTENGISVYKPVLVHILTQDINKFEEFKQNIEVLTKSLDVNICKELSGILNENYVREEINENTEVFVDVKQEFSMESITSKKLKLKKDLDKLLRYRSSKNYDKVLPEIQEKHSEKIFQLTSKLKQLEELEVKSENARAIK